MKKTVRFKNVDVVYNDHGKGSCVVLLHGYLEFVYLSVRNDKYRECAAPYESIPNDKRRGNP